MNELLQKLKNDKKRLLPGLLLAAAVLVLLLWAMVARVMVPANRYSQAEKLLAQGKYEEAAAAFDALEGYSDARDRSRQARYARGEELMNQGRFEEAISAFKALGDYENAPERVQDVRYARAEELLAQGV